MKNSRKVARDLVKKYYEYQGIAKAESYTDVEMEAEDSKSRDVDFAEWILTRDESEEMPKEATT